MKFPGIDLSPGALIMRQRSDKLNAQLDEMESIVKKAVACGAGTPADHANAAAQIARVKAEIQKIEREITS